MNGTLRTTPCCQRITGTRSTEAWFHKRSYVA